MSAGRWTLLTLLTPCNFQFPQIFLKQNNLLYLGHLAEYIPKRTRMVTLKTQNMYIGNWGKLISWIFTLFIREKNSTFFGPMSLYRQWHSISASSSSWSYHQKSMSNPENRIPNGRISVKIVCCCNGCSSSR